VSFWVDNQAAKKWLHPQAIAACRGVELTLTNTGTWDGQWSTEEDAIHLDILEEDMGAPVVFDFSNGALSQWGEPTILTADDATVHSFGTQLNGPLVGHLGGISLGRGSQGTSSLPLGSEEFQGIPKVPPSS